MGPLRSETEDRSPKGCEPTIFPASGSDVRFRPKLAMVPNLLSPTGLRQTLFVGSHTGERLGERASGGNVGGLERCLLGRVNTPSCSCGFTRQVSLDGCIYEACG